MRISYRTALACAGIFVVAGCKPKSPPPAQAPEATAPPAPAAAPLAVSSVDLGKGVDTEKRVTGSTNDFGPRDTIYASVETTGSAASATLAARWTYQTGQVVDSSSITIAPTGTARSEFHISKASPWPVGKYKVAILLNGAQVQEKEFEVKR